MAEIQTKETSVPVMDFINSLTDEGRKEDAKKLLQMIIEETGLDAKMWGPAIIGFGSSRLRYADGREIDWMKVAFSPRKQSMTLYSTGEWSTKQHILDKIGKHTTSKACFYFKRLSDLNEDSLRELIRIIHKEAGDVMDA